jgi:two-component system, OmpR family, phosphate regulon response regulator PhoB
MSVQVLVVEDEPEIGHLIVLHLAHAGYAALHVLDAILAAEALRFKVPDLILLDWMLPGQSGIEFARQLRLNPTTKSVPIILLTALSSDGDRLTGFSIGVDDYITKPFSPVELVARVRAVLRRAGPGKQAQVIEMAGLRLETEFRRVSTGIGQLKLGQTEFLLLQVFMRNPGKVFSREGLVSALWGNETDFDEHTVELHMRRLRYALSGTVHDRLIEIVRGGGYRFATYI